MSHIYVHKTILVLGPILILPLLYMARERARTACLMMSMSPFSLHTCGFRTKDLCPQGRAEVSL